MWNKLIVTLCLFLNTHGVLSHKEGCCKNRDDRPLEPPHIANFDCSQLESFGADV